MQTDRKKKKFIYFIQKIRKNDGKNKELGRQRFKATKPTCIFMDNFQTLEIYSLTCINIYFSFFPLSLSVDIWLKFIWRTRFTLWIWFDSMLNKTTDTNWDRCVCVDRDMETFQPHLFDIRLNLTTKRWSDACTCVQTHGTHIWR